MAAASCVVRRSLCRFSSQGQMIQTRSSVVCREPLSVISLQRYGRDLGSSIFFPQAVLSGDDLYDLTVSDGDCRLRVTLDPALNWRVERNTLRAGSVLRNSTFMPALSVCEDAGCPGSGRRSDSFRLVNVEEIQETGSMTGPDLDYLPWFTPTEPEPDPDPEQEPPGPLVPLRANRSTFLPLWNSTDFSGEVWRETVPSDGEDEEEREEEAERPSVMVHELYEGYLSGLQEVTVGVVTRHLIVRIINKSHLMYYGKTDRNCQCPYKAMLEVCDRTASVCVVLWNSVCVEWYRSLRPGQILKLSRYRVKPRYAAKDRDIEISVNSRNPTTHISILPEFCVSPNYRPPQPVYNFYCGKELLDCPHGHLCDVIGLVTFSGRPERIRSKADGHPGQRVELLEYRWLRLEDGTSDQPIMVKLFSTSQPEMHNKLHPLSVVVVTRLKVVKTTAETDECYYLSNTAYTQVYCTGCHSSMSYRKLRPVRTFLQWLQRQNDEQVLSRALVGGFFIFPPPPISLETYMKHSKGHPGFLRGAELQRELSRLCYRERRTFCIQATVTMVTYCIRGQEDQCVVWTNRASSFSPCSSSSLLSSPPSCQSSSPRSPRAPPPSSPRSVTSSVSQPRPYPLDSRASRTPSKRKWSDLQTRREKKRRPLVTTQPDQDSITGALWEASMEFLQRPVDEEDSSEDDEDAWSFITAPLPPATSPVAMETLPLRYSHAQREEQAVVVSLQSGQWRRSLNEALEKFDPAVETYYTLTLRALSDCVLFDVVFLPVSPLSSSCSTHSNTWLSILSHGAFSSHTPPPSPADLIGVTTQLANQRLVCILEACHLGGSRTEIMLSRAFPLTQ